MLDQVEHQEVLDQSGTSGSSGSASSSGLRGAKDHQDLEVQSHQGLTGAEGNNAGTRYNFSNSTVDADQEQVYLDLCASCIATVVFIDVLDFGSNDMTTYMEFLEYINITYKGAVTFEKLKFRNCL
jgi:hypothetical protein